MGCNAWNHSPNCNCGWGGQYHESYSSQKIPTQSVKSISPGYSTPFSLTNNAACPVCGAPVFFFSNENGSKVFFDSLGPPWPKHPCTDVAFQASATLPIGPHTLEKILSQPIIDGGLWRDLFDLVVKDTGIKPSTLIMSQRAKPRTLAYIKQARDAFASLKSSADTIQRQSSINSRLERLLTIEHEINRLIRAAEISSAAAKASATAVTPSTQLTPDLNWMDVAIVGHTPMVDDYSVVDVAEPYPGTMRMELLVLGHTPFVLGSPARVLRLPGSKLHILHGMRPEQVLIFAVRSYSDFPLLSRRSRA